MSSEKLVFSIFDTADARWCLQQAKDIIHKYPCSERSNSSGKFFNTYQCYHFHKSSSLPLIKYFAKLCTIHAQSFKERFNKNLQIDFIVLTYIEDASVASCLWHKDGYFFDGQMHLTILGKASLEFKMGGGGTPISHLQLPNGTFWYFNSSHFFHKISVFKGQRIEMVAPVNQLEADLKLKLQAVSLESSEKLLSNSNPIWTSVRKNQAQYVLKSIQQGKASNLNIADFSIDPRKRNDT